MSECTCFRGDDDPYYCFELCANEGFEAEATDTLDTEESVRM